MGAEKISEKQGINLAIMFIFGSTLVMGTGGRGKNAGWISILLAVAFSVPIYIAYARILTRYPGKSLYEILEVVFGKYLGRLITIIYIWFFFHLGALVLRNFGEFMNTVGLPETPKIVPIIIFALICILAVKSGIETLARCSSYFIIVTIFLLVLLALFTLPIIDTKNFLPIMGEGMKSIFEGTFDAFSFPFGELFVFVAVFDSLKEPKLSSKVFINALLVGGLLVAFINARNIMVLGVETASAVYFPSYTAISRVNIGNFLQRLEISVTIVFLLCGFVKISICLLAAAKGLTQILGFKDYRKLVTPIGLLMVNLSYLIYDSIMEMFEWAQEVWPYYAFPFQVILPLLILIAVEIKAYIESKSMRSKKGQNSGQ